LREGGDDPSREGVGHSSMEGGGRSSREGGHSSREGGGSLLREEGHCSLREAVHQEKPFVYIGHSSTEAVCLERSFAERGASLSRVVERGHSSREEAVLQGGRLFSREAAIC
jgi:hypothetical protein